MFSFAEKQWVCSTFRLHSIFGNPCLEERIFMLQLHMRTWRIRPTSISTALGNSITHCECLNPILSALDS